MRRSLDYEDIALHAIAASAITLILCIIFNAQGFNTFFAPLINFLFWLTREIVQDINKGRIWPNVWPLRRSAQKDAETLAPAVSGMLIWGAFVMVV